MNIFGCFFGHTWVYDLTQVFDGTLVRSNYVLEVHWKEKVKCCFGSCTKCSKKGKFYFNIRTGKWKFSEYVLDIKKGV